MRNRKICQTEEEILEIKRVILVGYESYSESMIYNAKNMLKNKFPRIDVVYGIYENQKYITKGMQSKIAIRHLEGMSASDKKGYIDKALIIYIVGIFSTLSNFEKINTKFDEIFVMEEENTQNNIKHCISVIQVVDEKMPNKYISVEQSDCGIFVERYCKSKRGYIDFTRDERARYLIDVKSQWYEPSNCPLFFPEKYIDEQPLVFIEENSVVPTQLIRLEKKELLEVIEVNILFSQNQWIQLFLMIRITRGFYIMAISIEGIIIISIT